MRFSVLRESAASKQRSRLFMVSLGLFGLAMFVTFAWIGFTAPNRIPGRTYYYLWAEFKDADNITPHNEVRVDGDIVGQVLNPHVENGVGVAELQLSPSVAPLRSDTHVAVVPRSAIGVRYVEITPGLHGSELKSGSMIPMSQTSASTPLDTVLSTFNAPTRANVQKFLGSFGEGLLGEGQNINMAIKTAPAFMNNTDSVLQAVIDRPGAVANLLQGAATLSSTADPVRSTIANGFRPEAGALRPFAQSTSNIDATLSQAPPTLNTVTDKLPAFDALATQLSGFATNIEPGLAASPAAFTQTSRLLKQAEPELVSATGVLKETGQAVNPTLSLLTTVQPVLSPINSGLTSATPIVDVLGAHGCDIINFGKHWTSMQEFGNSEGNVLRFEIASAGTGDLYGLNYPTDPPYSGAYPAPCTSDGGQPIP